jgi:hypothetical protein
MGVAQVGKLFQIILNKTVALKDVKIAGRDGELLQCWDLFVGQKIDVLGKPTTLMQASHATLMWLEFHARRLLKKALELENEIMQFKPIPDIVHRMLNTRVCLRAWVLVGARVCLRAWVLVGVSPCLGACGCSGVSPCLGACGCVSVPGCFWALASTLPASLSALCLSLALLFAFRRQLFPTVPAGVGVASFLAALAMTAPPTAPRQTDAWCGIPPTTTTHTEFVQRELEPAVDHEAHFNVDDAAVSHQARRRQVRLRPRLRPGRARPDAIGP